MRDPYSILGLSPDAGADDIKAAYRRLAKQFHPDARLHDPQDAEPDLDMKRMSQRFHEVSRAYQILRKARPRNRIEPERKAAATETAGNKPGRAHAPKGEFREAPAPERKAAFTGHFVERNANKVEADFSPFFEASPGDPSSVFRTKGENRAYQFSLSLEEAALGAIRRISLDGGKALDVHVPPGIESGQTIRLRGKGKEGFGGAAAGDALILVTVEPHHLFRRQGDDIHLSLSVSLRDAILGATVEVETLTGPVRLDIPPWSNSGRTLTLPGMGFLRPDGSRDDQHVSLIIMLPETEDKGLQRFIRDQAI